MTVSKIPALQAISGMFSVGKTMYVPQFTAQSEGVAFNFSNGKYNLNHPLHGGYEGSTKAINLDYSA